MVARSLSFWLFVLASISEKNLENGRKFSCPSSLWLGLRSHSDFCALARCFKPRWWPGSCCHKPALPLVWTLKLVSAISVFRKVQLGSKFQRPLFLEILLYYRCKDRIPWKIHQFCPYFFYTFINSLPFLLTHMLGYPSGDIFKPIELRFSTCASVDNVVVGSLLGPLIRVSTSVKGLANNSNEKLSYERPNFFLSVLVFYCSWC